MGSCYSCYRQMGPGITKQISYLGVIILTLTGEGEEKKEREGKILINKFPKKLENTKKDIRKEKKKKKVEEKEEEKRILRNKKRKDDFKP